MKHNEIQGPWLDIAKIIKATILSAHTSKFKTGNIVCNPEIVCSQNCTAILIAKAPFCGYDARIEFYEDSVSLSQLNGNDILTLSGQATSLDLVERLLIAKPGSIERVFEWLRQIGVPLNEKMVQQILS